MKEFKFFKGYIDDAFPPLREWGQIRIQQPRLIANELVSIQPLSLSSGRLNYEYDLDDEEQ